MTGIRYTGDCHIPVIKIGSCRTHHLWERLLKPEEVCNYRRLGYMTLNDLRQTIEQLFVYTDNKITCDILHLEIPTLRVYNKHSFFQEPRKQFRKSGRNVNNWSDWLYRNQVGIMAGYDYHKYKMSKHVFEQYFDNIMSIIPDDIHVVIQTSFNIQLCEEHATELRDKNEKIKDTMTGGGDLLIYTRGQVEIEDHEVKPILTQDNRFVAREKCDAYIHHAISKHADRISLIDLKDIYGDRKSDVLTERDKDGLINFGHYTDEARELIIDYITNNLSHLLPNQKKS